MENVSLATSPVAAVPVKVKPRYRGVSHLVAFFLATGGCAWLLEHAPAGRAKLAAGIYGLTLMALFGISALYHRPMWSLPMRAVMRRFDHAGIFIFIAGCYTPLCILGLPAADAENLLWFAWIAATAGAIHAAFFVHSFRTLNAVLFVIMGCAIIPYVPQLQQGMAEEIVDLILAGGAIYITGAIMYARRWPNPDPTTFGYHEVFHLVIVLASGIHYAAFFQLVVG